MIFCSALISAQQTKILGDFSMKASSYSAKVFEKSNLNIYYQFKFLKDTKISQNPREGLCILQIGENYSKFSDTKTLQRDSIFEKFSHLESVPGLILELEDSQNRYHFTAVGIDKKPIDIYLRSDKEILKISRAKFREVEKTYHDNPGAFHGKALNEDGSPMVVRSKPLLYDPFELE
ncbi:hypothetical protein [Chryseobacterium sp. CFBP8996]|uniref:hypothetical protein n=1 Tax=Chryseobacterium sp. CFBP8996 TaxID=3096529 RepID=UPI002A6A3C2A|nr:hypothetical protein [Chryseobacterium sp. CFBP8996]